MSLSAVAYNPSMMIPDYATLKLQELLCRLKERLFDCRPHESVAFDATDPDLCAGRYAGERVIIDEEQLLCRSWHAWTTLAQQLGCRMLTPERIGSGRVRIRYQKLATESFHREKNETEEKYATDGTFARIQKMEEPAFAYDYMRALQRLKIGKRRRILDLGLNRGDELEPIWELAGEKAKSLEITGIDLACDALTEAQKRWPGLRTFCHDLNRLDELELGRFDLILSIGTLQSPGIEMKPLIMDLIQKHLAPEGAILLGWPNARWIDGELLYGAHPKNYPFPELSLVIKDLFWIKKYLQQHRFRVVVTGREYLFLEATRISR